MKTLVLGLGNPICGDDGVGWRVIGELRARLNQPGVTIAETSTAGLDILELLAGYDRAIIVDAIQTEEGKTGQVYRLEPDDIKATRHSNNPHDISFADALELGNQLGLELPRQITIFGIEVNGVSSFGEECAPAVTKAIPGCVQRIVQELNGH